MQLNALYLKFLICHVKTYLLVSYLPQKRYTYIFTYVRIINSGKEGLFCDDGPFHPLGVRPSVRNILISKNNLYVTFTYVRKLMIQKT